MQDNNSSILLGGNGKFSRFKRTKHIKARYFFVANIVAQGDLEIEHFLTERVWADILTKPLQFRTFTSFRVKLMNFPVDYEDKSTQ